MKSKKVNKLSLNKINVTRLTEDQQNMINGKRGSVVNCDSHNGMTRKGICIIAPPPFM